MRPNDPSSASCAEIKRIVRRKFGSSKFGCAMSSEPGKPSDEGLNSRTKPSYERADFPQDFLHLGDLQPQDSMLHFALSNSKIFHMKANVIVMPKRSVLDPQGVAVRDAIHHHGLPEVKSVRIGKFMEIEID